MGHKTGGTGPGSPLNCIDSKQDFGFFHSINIFNSFFANACTLEWIFFLPVNNILTQNFFVKKLKCALVILVASKTEILFKNVFTANVKRKQNNKYVTSNNISDNQKERTRIQN